MHAAACAKRTRSTSAQPRKASAPSSRRVARRTKTCLVAVWHLVSCALRRARSANGQHQLMPRALRHPAQSSPACRAPTLSVSNTLQLRERAPTCASKCRRSHCRCQSRRHCGSSNSRRRSQSRHRNRMCCRRSGSRQSCCRRCHRRSRRRAARMGTRKLPSLAMQEQSL